MSLSLIGILFTSASFAAQKPDFNATQTKSIEKIIHHYLVNNPQILQEMVMKLRQDALKQQQNQTTKAAEKTKTELFQDTNSPIAGNPNGTKIMVEFFDYQCPHCKEMNTAIKNLMKKNPNLKVIFKEWPIFEGASKTAALAALAANQQGKYFALHEALLEANNPLAKDKILALAKSVGLNMPKLKQAMNSKKLQDEINANFALAKQLKLEGTPAFVITDKAETAFKFVPGATTQQDLQKLLNDV
jgi:protein-disulfide isomerase